MKINIIAAAVAAAGAESFMRHSYSVHYAHSHWTRLRISDHLLSDLLIWIVSACDETRSVINPIKTNEKRN